LNSRKLAFRQGERRHGVLHLWHPIRVEQVVAFQPETRLDLRRVGLGFTARASASTGERRTSSWPSAWGCHARPASR
jgi:hypothetical protein